MVYQKTVTYQKIMAYQKTVTYQKIMAYQKTMVYQKIMAYQQTVTYHKIMAYQKTVAYQKIIAYQKTVTYQKTMAYQKIMGYQKTVTCLTRTCPKRLHVLCKYTLSKFNAYNKNDGIRDCGCSLPFRGREWEVRVNSAGRFVCVFLSLNKV